MKLSGNFDVSGVIAKEDERYKVIDNTTLNNLVLSSTKLNPGHSTTGHKHAGQEEVYIFVSGVGNMTLTYPDGKEENFSVTNGDIVLIEDDVHHRVFNNSENELYFVCVFDGKRSHQIKFMLQKLLQMFQTNFQLLPPLSILQLFLQKSLCALQHLASHPSMAMDFFRS